MLTSPLLCKKFFRLPIVVLLSFALLFIHLPSTFSLFHVALKQFNEEAARKFRPNAYQTARARKGKQRGRVLGKMGQKIADFNNAFPPAREILLALRYNAENREHTPAAEKGARNSLRNLRGNVPRVENRANIIARFFFPSGPVIIKGYPHEKPIEFVGSRPHYSHHSSRRTNYQTAEFQLHVRSI